jgi:hypothetical protein
MLGLSPGASAVDAHVWPRNEPDNLRRCDARSEAPPAPPWALARMPARNLVLAHECVIEYARWLEFREG